MSQYESDQIDAEVEDLFAQDNVWAAESSVIKAEYRSCQPAEDGNPLHDIKTVIIVDWHKNVEGAGVDGYLVVETAQDKDDDYSEHYGSYPTLASALRKATGIAIRNEEAAQERLNEWRAAQKAEAAKRVQRDEVVRIAQAAGFEVTQTGGGCTALIKDLEGNRHAMITDEAEVPESMDAAVQLGFYNDGEGEQLVGFFCPNVHTALDIVRHYN